MEYKAAQNRVAHRAKGIVFRPTEHLARKNRHQKQDEHEQFKIVAVLGSLGFDDVKSAKEQHGGTDQARESEYTDPIAFQHLKIFPKRPQRHDPQQGQKPKLISRKNSRKHQRPQHQRASQA